MRHEWSGNPAVPSRQRLRISNYDYSKNGAYFITFCTKLRVPSLARVKEGALQLSLEGRAVLSTWQELPRTFPHVRLDALAIMPDHVHAILWIVRYNIATVRPLVPITTAIGIWKSRAARQINFLRGTPGTQVWHRSFHERIVPDKSALSNIRRYIANNSRRYLESHRG